MNSCFIGCITLFIPLDWESEKAVLRLPELGGTSWCSECSPTRQGQVSCLSSLPCHLPPFPSPRDCLRTRLPPPISAEKRISACSDGHHLGTPSRGHPRPKLTPCSTCWREFAEPWGCLPSVSPVAFLENVKSLRRRQNSWQWQDSAPLFIREKSKLVTLCTE